MTLRQGLTFCQAHERWAEAILLELRSRAWMGHALRAPSQMAKSLLNGYEAVLWTGRTV